MMEFELFEKFKGGLWGEEKRFMYEWERKGVGLGK